MASGYVHDVDDTVKITITTKITHATGSGFTVKVQDQPVTIDMISAKYGGEVKFELVEKATPPPKVGDVVAGSDVLALAKRLPVGTVIQFRSYGMYILNRDGAWYGADTVRILQDPNHERAWKILFIPEKAA